MEMKELEGYIRARIDQDRRIRNEYTDKGQREKAVYLMGEMDALKTVLEMIAPVATPKN